MSRMHRRVALCCLSSRSRSLWTAHSATVSLLSATTRTPSFSSSGCIASKRRNSALQYGHHPPRKNFSNVRFPANWSVWNATPSEVVAPKASSLSPTSTLSSPTGVFR
jgi:hypothetical protein